MSVRRRLVGEAHNPVNAPHQQVATSWGEGFSEALRTGKMNLFGPVLFVRGRAHRSLAGCPA
jgi:hypothetical protein